MRSAGAGCEADPIRKAARAAFAAELAFFTARTDDEAERAAGMAIDKAHALAAAPGASPGAIGFKLATLVRLRAASLHYDLDAADGAELMLLASALADCVILGDRPLSSISAPDTANISPASAAPGGVAPRAQVSGADNVLAYPFRPVGEPELP